MPTFIFLIYPHFLRLPDSKTRTQKLLRKLHSIFLTGLNPVNMPTYPTKLVALKTVLLFLWKSKFTVKGFSSSVITQVLLFIFHLKKTNVGDIKDRDGVERRHYIGAACLCLGLAMESKMTSTLQSSCLNLPKAGITGLRFHVWLIGAFFACSLRTNINKIFMSVLWFGSGTVPQRLMCSRPSPQCTKLQR